MTSPYEYTKNRMSISKQPADTEIMAMPLKKETKSDQKEEEEEAASDVEIRLMSRPTSNAAWIASIRADIQSLLKHYRQRVSKKL